MRVLLALVFMAALVAANKPTFTYCDKDGSNYEYQMDLQQTYTEPEIVEKNINMELFINGYFLDDVELTDLEINVYWGGALLQKIDEPDTDKVYSYNPYTLTFKVFIPSFAMNGDYYLEAYTKGKVLGGEEKVLSCLRGDFTI